MAKAIRIVAGSRLWPALFAIVLALIFVPNDLGIPVLATTVILFLAWLVFPYYREAPDHLMRSIVSSAFFGFTMGYFAY
ncbi:hypothetical protein E2F50_04950 [Rhizobium deserti]|uniref:Uncharacterized protein n=1 Tax=Rhizobium deserti TaxID=2547961 RepID=A0A4R5UNX1_9HYPH|nr:hypothetical protein [Rhizobium deserti]TDK39464.1 hypothetical protein E2F50_04950 [Rhizobium deserti]